MVNLVKTGLHSEASWAETQLKKEQDAIDRGKVEKAVEVAEKAIRKDYPIPDIVEISGLTEAEVLLIKSHLGK